MSTCITCGGRIDAYAFAMRTKVATKRGVPVTPPKRCSECAWAALLTMACTEDVEVKDDGAPSGQKASDR